MRDKEYYNSVFESKMTFSDFISMCEDLCDEKIENWRKRHPSIGLSISNFKGWEPWVDSGYKGPLTITCRYRYLRSGKNRNVYDWNAEETEFRRRDYLDIYGFHRVKK